MSAEAAVLRITDVFGIIKDAPSCASNARAKSAAIIESDIPS